MTILNDRFTRPLLAAGENLGFLDDSSGVFMASAHDGWLRSRHIPKRVCG